MNVVNLFLLSAGALLIWCSVTNRNPLEVVRAVFTGKDIPEKGSWK